MTNYLQMTTRDLQIKDIMDKLINKELWLKEAAWLIGRSRRQVIRIKNKYIKEWVVGLIHKLRGKKSNHSHDPAKYKDALEIIKERYHDYGPTLASEKLEDKHGIKISIPTLRNEMIREWIWKCRKRKKVDKQRESRPRKENYWEMIQYDWSYHLWLENRYEELCLLVSVDDATWELYAKFDKNEWLEATFKYWLEYIKLKWKPKSIYLDKFATYKINHPNATDDRDLTTQFWRACKKLWIQLIFANSPQWKGRVERMNWTLQDRLVKDLREEKIRTMENANKYLQEKFIPKFNKKYKVIPRWNCDLHSHLRKDEIEILNQIFSEHKERKIMNDYTIRYENKFYQLYRDKNGWVIFYKWEKVIVEKHLSGDIKISKKWKYINYEILPEKPQRMYKLPLAPVSQEDSTKIKKEIEKREEEAKTSKNMNNVTKKETYFKENWKPHPWMKNFKI